MTNATNFVPCTDIETRQAMWVGYNNQDQLGVFNAVQIASAFADRYADDFKAVTFDD
jgi:hypothetical protein